MTMVTTATEVTPEEQALLKLRLEEAVQGIVEKAILQAFNSPEFYYALSATQGWNYLRHNATHHDEFKGQVLRAIKEHFNKHFI